MLVLAAVNVGATINRNRYRLFRRDLTIETNGGDGKKERVLCAMLRRVLTEQNPSPPEARPCLAARAPLRERAAARVLSR